MSDQVTHFIGGVPAAEGATFATHDPVTGRPVRRVHEADRAVVDRAVAAARAALPGWAALPVAERAAWMRRLADAIEERFEDLVAAEIADTGKSITQTRTLDIPRGAANFRSFAEIAAQRPESAFHLKDVLSYTVRRPLGVVAVIVPWNLPFLLATWKIGPSLVAGNTIVVKPSEHTPGSVAVLAEIAASIGLPPGVLNVVHGFGAGSTGQFLVEHPGVDAVTFTGESRTGSTIMKSVADRVKPVSFELGGKNAGLVFADADLDAAVEGSVRSVFTNGGQVCLCTERLYVERPVFEEFTARLAERAGELRFGRPADEDTTMMPMISAEHRDKVLSYYGLAKDEGARIHAGGGVPHFGDDRDGGYYVEPTVLTGLSRDSRVNREEIFGPVCHIAPFDTEAEAVELANDSDYGLAATVWTADLNRAHRVARSLEAGLVWVNTWYLRDLRTPFGGVKLSGIGREGGTHSLDFYSEPTTITIKLEPGHD
ncbi:MULTISPECIES: 2-hydroxymuconic semialdehyde dehydrogenase [Streptosporangium]|uniref:Aminomuconate-semialdehyde/2-hydroxymuconate-6-semialdehyde dehydrogenase n=1 Tax=Streptosporangium brasiliense TaxID=47480 RepID=A0ABT9R5C5_9ACTN|nr:2-hydroxymuconic semialdehyde dehydrogenase [Streptosporangium brasiliense]MDP9864436.1 aminomuconate-semialdehyde/2-hydroxymuconate-6-semialdehyde dehydrogenase [Streptosporangium brasiliense]